jgi:hypothetical protein
MPEAKKPKSGKRWSAEVTEHSNALDLENRVFASDDPKKVARSLKRSAERSKRKKGTPLQSAMSMLNFYINRAGGNLPARRKKVLEEAKDELRQLFGRQQIRSKPETKSKTAAKKRTTKTTSGAKTRKARK